MAFDDTPTSWLAGYTLDDVYARFSTLDGDGTLPVATSDIDPATGDIRVLFFGLCEMMADAWDAQDVADRPNKMTVQRYSSINQNGDQITTSYTVSIVTDVLTQDITAE